MNTQSDRAARFVADLEELKIKDPSADRPVIVLRLSSAVMFASVVLGVIAYFVSHGTTDPLAQRDAIVLGLLAVTLAVVGGIVYLRFALTNFLRFWLARQSFDLQMRSESATSVHGTVTQQPTVSMTEPQLTEVDR